jgi:hypothetical protein
LGMLWMASNALLQYAMTGEQPKDGKDLVAGRIGGVDSHGKPRRVSAPAIVFKDAMSLWYGGAANYISAKRSDLLIGVNDVFNNEDFRHNMIHNPEDSWWKQRYDDAAHVLGLPIGVSSYKQERESGTPKSESLLGLLGFSPTTRLLDMSPAERLLLEISKRNAPTSAWTPEETKQYYARQRILADLRKGNRQSLIDAEQSRQLTSAQAHNLMRLAKLTPLQAHASSSKISYADMVRIYERADEQEKKQLLPILHRKRDSALRRHEPVTAESF